MIRKSVKIIVFFLILSVLLLRFHQVFRFKFNDGIYGMEQFYEEKEYSLDAIFFGSSHMYVNVNTSVLWKEYGIAGYDLGGSEQPVWNSYYYVKEALKTQKPSVLVLDCYTVCRSGDYVDESRIIKNTYGMKFSRDKIEAVKASSPESDRVGYLLEYPTYHGRYGDLSRSDFGKYADTEFMRSNSWKGQYLHTGIHSQPQPGTETITETAELDERSERYLRGTIELAREAGVPILLMVVPYVPNPEETRFYNRMEEIAGEYGEGVDFVNFNPRWEEMGLDFSVDYMDTCHMNYQGSEKFTRYLAEYLKARYALPDHRGDDTYQSYDDMARYYDRFVYNDRIRKTTELPDYLAKLWNPDYVTVFFIKSDYKTMSNYNEVRDLLAGYGISLDEVSGDAVWAVQNGNVLFASGDAAEYCWHQELGRYDVLTVRSGQGKQEQTVPQVFLNDSSYSMVNDGLNILTYDLVGENLVECAGFAIVDGTMEMGKR